MNTCRARWFDNLMRPVSPSLLYKRSYLAPKKHTGPYSWGRRFCLQHLRANSHEETSPEFLSFNPYEDLVRGKRFVCTECGKCCTGAGEVWVNSEECSAIANTLGLRLPHFLSKYTKGYNKRPGWRLLKRAQGSEDCVFLVDGTKCSIYGARPLQCATYPWWPELMSPEAWIAERDIVCEGISHPESPEVDPKEKGEMLRLATEQLAALQEAAARQKRQPEETQHNPTW